MKRFSLLLAVVCLLGFTSIATATCDDVDHVNLTVSSWTVDEFYEPGTSTLLDVELTIAPLESSTEVEYWNGSAWIPVTGPVEVSGSKTRVRNGAASIHMEYGDCSEDVQPEWM